LYTTRFVAAGGEIGAGAEVCAEACVEVCAGPAVVIWVDAGVELGVGVEVHKMTILALVAKESNLPSSGAVGISFDS